MRIVQEKTKEIDRHGSYFFGRQNAVWAPVFVEMLSRKLDKLRISNNPYTTYQSHQEADMLIEVSSILLLERLSGVTIGGLLSSYENCLPIKDPVRTCIY